MKSNYKIAAAVIGSFVLGLGAASVLHAQAKPPGFASPKSMSKIRTATPGFSAQGASQHQRTRRQVPRRRL